VKPPPIILIKFRGEKQMVKKRKTARDSGSVWDHPSAQTKVQKEILYGFKMTQKIIGKKTKKKNK